MYKVLHFQIGFQGKKNMRYSFMNKKWQATSGYWKMEKLTKAERWVRSSNKSGVISVEKEEWVSEQGMFWNPPFLSES